ncbi:MAG: hypothetical protein R3C59_25645 [Planctomycetaceae bacterium]
MSIEMTQMIYTGIMFVAALVWILSLRKAARLGKNACAPADTWPLGDTFESDVSGDVAGVQTIRGRRPEVSRLLGQTLLNSGVPGVFATLFEMTERTDERIQIRKTGPLVCNQPSGMYFSEAVFDLTASSSNTVEVHYRLGFERLRRGMRLTALAIILGLGLPVMLIVGTVLWIFVVNNANPIVRWQVFQALQVVHVLWPPFLVMGIFNSGRRHSRTWISNLMRSVELASETAAAQSANGR